MKIEIEIPDGISAKDFKETVDELCSKGIGNGCYQDYNLLLIVLSCMTQVETTLAKQEVK